MPKKRISLPNAIADDLVCACHGLRLGDYQRQLKENSELSFEDILRKTGAGATCTVCLLDLEYFYVNTPRDKPQVNRNSGVSKKDNRSIKRKVFDFIDKISPAVPYKLANRFPVISGPGIDQHIWVSNRSLLFEGKHCGPSFDVNFIVRDSCGNICHQESKNVMPEAALDFPVSNFITPPQDENTISVGSIEVVRRGCRPGSRGTTRPQTEILAKSGACSVHGQSYKYPGERWFSLTHSPEDQRVFLSFINFSKHQNQVIIEYPMDVPDLQIEKRKISASIPGNGAHIHEILITSEEANFFAGHHLAIKWTASHEYNCHIFCASPDLSRFSIDHS